MRSKHCFFYDIDTTNNIFTEILLVFQVVKSSIALDLTKLEERHYGIIQSQVIFVQ